MPSQAQRSRVRRLKMRLANVSSVVRSYRMTRWKQKHKRMGHHPVMTVGRGGTEFAPTFKPVMYCITCKQTKSL